MLCTFLIAYPYGKNIFSVNGSQKLGQIADGKGIFYWMVLTLEIFIRKLYRIDRKSQQIWQYF